MIQITEDPLAYCIPECPNKCLEVKSNKLYADGEPYITEYYLKCTNEKICKM